MRCSEVTNLIENCFEISITGVFNLICTVKVNNEKVIDTRIENAGNPIKQLIFYYEHDRYVIYLCFDYKPFRKSLLIIVINNILCVGSLKTFIRLVNKYKVKIFESKYYDKQKTILSVLMYSIGSGIYCSVMFSLINRFLNEEKYINTTLTSIILFSIVMGLTKWYTLKKMRVNGIDEIKVDQIVTTEFHLTTAST